jgi:hypothetical protein
MNTKHMIQTHTVAMLAAAALSFLPGCASRSTSFRTPDGRPMSGDYQKGRSDGVKTIYWNLQDKQRTKPPEARYGNYEVIIPEHWENGALVKPSSRVLRIQE